MFSFSDLEPQHTLTGAQVQTNVAAMKERKKKNPEINEKKGQRRKRWIQK